MQLRFIFTYCSPINSLRGGRFVLKFVAIWHLLLVLELGGSVHVYTHTYIHVLCISMTCTETLWLSMELNHDILIRSTSQTTIDRTTWRWNPFTSKVGLKDATAAVASFALHCGAWNIYLDVVRSIVVWEMKIHMNYFSAK